MKKIAFLSLFIALIPVLIVVLQAYSQASAAKPVPTFEMVDGYFYVPGAKPMHLMDALKEYVLNRGDDVDIHLDLVLKPKDATTCTKKEEKSCSLTIQFVENDASGKEIIVQTKHVEIPFGPQTGFGWPDKVPRTIASDKAVVRILISRDDTEYFRFDIPIGVH